MASGIAQLARYVRAGAGAGGGACGGCSRARRRPWLAKYAPHRTAHRPPWHGRAAASAPPSPFLRQRPGPAWTSACCSGWGVAAVGSPRWAGKGAARSCSTPRQPHATPPPLAPNMQAAAGPLMERWRTDGGGTLHACTVAGLGGYMQRPQPTHACTCTCTCTCAGSNWGNPCVAQSPLDSVLIYYSAGITRCR